MSRNEIISLIILIGVIAFGAYNYINREYSDIRSKYILDTIVEISASSKKKTVSSEIESVFVYISELQEKLDEYDPNSLISQINFSDEEHFEMDPDIYELLKLSEELYTMTDGAFDPTIKPVWDLWNFTSENPIPPDSTLIAQSLHKVGFSRLKYDQNTLFKPSDVQLTFGAISKGYILDKAKKFMQEKGFHKGYINCRSSMCFFGYKISPLIYIQHPRNSDDYIASLKILNQSVGTSGDYQQYFEYNGIRYHHILDAHTGYPVQNVYSVTVINDSAAMADGLSTALFTLGPDRAMQIISSLENTNAIIYYLQDDSIVSLKSEGVKNLQFTENL